MTVASRTPEGTPGRCPLCGAKVLVEPSIVFGDAPCPNCGTLLWFLRELSGPRFYAELEAELRRARVRKLIAEHLGTPLQDLTDEQMRALGIDSLALVELLMELEEDE